MNVGTELKVIEEAVSRIKDFFYYH
jgi:hypothetical protein